MKKILLRKNSVVEKAKDEFKNICHVKQTRHRSLAGFILNIMRTIVAYSFFPKKPFIEKDIEEIDKSKITQLNQEKLIAI